MTKNIILTILSTILLTGWINAATITVTNTNDSGIGSFRQAILDVMDGDEITFSAQGVITLVSELPIINETITITGHTDGTVISGNNACRILTVQIETGTLTLNNLNFKDAYSTNGAASGLYAITGNDGLINLNRCSFYNCSSTGSQAYGGAIATSADLNLTNCTISENTAAESGGALATISNCSVTLLNCTIYKNHTSNASGTGGLDISQATITIQNSILAGNTAGSTPTNTDLQTSLGGSLSSLGNNMSNTAPFSHADDLTNKNLSTEIMLNNVSFQSGMYVCQLQNGSGAINQANIGTAPGTDQIGQSRLGHADIGSFENQNATAPAVTTQSTTSISQTAATLNGNVTDVGAPYSTQHGFVYGTETNPDLSLPTKTEQGSIENEGSITTSLTGLTPNMTYYVRAYATNTAGTTYGNETSFSTLPATTTTFNIAGNWSEVENWNNGLPASTTDAVIAANCNADGNFETASLTINGGVILYIKPDQTISVPGEITNNNGVNGIVIESNVTGSGRLINNSVNVQASVQMYIAKDKWHYFGKPISNAFDANTYFHNFYLISNNESAGETNPWSYLTVNDPINNASGYGAYYSRSSNSDTTITFQGYLNSGNITTTTSYTNTPIDTCGWNLISNPYPCTTDWEIVKTNLTNVNDAIYVWDPIAGTYASYVSGTSTGNQDQYIAPMQGFFVKANTNAGSVLFTNTAKTNANSTFKSNSINSTFKLLLTNDDSHSDETVVRITPDGSVDFDPKLDAYKLLANYSQTPQIYTRNKHTNYSINTIPDIDENSIIPLSMLIKSEGFYTLSLDKSNYFEGFPINLFSSDGTLLAELDVEDYTLNTTKKGVNEFFIGFKSSSTNSEKRVKSNIYLHVDIGLLTVYRLSNIPSLINVYTTSGQKVFSQNVCTNKLSIPLPANNIYLVSVNQQNGNIFNGKALINN